MMKQWMNNRRKKKAELLLQSLDVDELAGALAQHIDYDVLARKTEMDYEVLAREVVDNIDHDDVAGTVAQNFDANDIARELDFYDLAGYIDMDDLAGYIDMNEFVRQAKLDMGDLASHFDMDELVSHIPTDAVAEALAATPAALADDRLTAMVECLNSMAEAFGLAVTTMQMSIKED